MGTSEENLSVDTGLEGVNELSRYVTLCLISIVTRFFDLSVYCSFL